MHIRTAQTGDLKAIVDIYNQAVAAEATADQDPVTVDGRLEWFGHHPPDQHPILVAELDGQVAGWASLSAYRRGRRAVRHTAEISYYVDSTKLRRGLGSSLVNRCIELCPSLKINTLFAILLEDNAASIGLLEAFDFDRWGYLPRVADFNGREVGHLYYGRRVC